MSSSQAGSKAKPESITWTLTRRLGMVIILALAFALSAIVTIYTLFRSGETRVPDVLGKSEPEASKMIEKAGLGLKVQRRNDSAPANTVIDINRPVNSAVKKGFTITIVVSTGPAQTKTELRFFIDGDRSSVRTSAPALALVRRPEA
jgi:PASTA domain-containing protein